MISLKQADFAPDNNHFKADPIDNVVKDWDSIATLFSDVCAEQMAAFNVPKWGSSRLSGLVLRDVLTNEPEAAALAVVVTLPVLKYGLAYFKFGPLWRRRGHAERPGILAAMLEAVKAEFAVARGLLVRVMPPAEADQKDTWKESLEQAGFELHKPMVHPERYLVDLSLTADEQLQSLGSKWRANLNKAVRSGVEVREVDPKTHLSAFLAIYRAMTERKQFFDRHSIETLGPMIAASSSTAGVRLFLASHHGKTVAGSLVICVGSRVSVPFSATTRDALGPRAGYALRWAIIDDLRGSGARWLDLGGDEGDEGLRHFKRGNVGRRGVIARIPGEFDFSSSPISTVTAALMGCALDLKQSASQFAVKRPVSERDGISEPLQTETSS